MKAIVCVSENWGIGKNGKMLFHLPADLLFFKQNTLNKIVVMGRSTFESLPSGALKDRTNIVLTSNSDFSAKDITVLGSIPQLLDFIKKYDPEDIYVIGGEQIYTQLLTYCSACLITKVFASAPADTFFPNLDLIDNWEIAGSSGVFEQNGLKYSHIEYINKK